MCGLCNLVLFGAGVCCGRDIEGGARRDREQKQTNKKIREIVSHSCAFTLAYKRWRRRPFKAKD